ncbi:efflux RND transporter periplasmic adaptor subunit [Roseicyclus mahoneyensis]|uniref:Multidrug efflux system membrane fusion protein n=1 Tax=Roseicyclus mahoneyensis TaxID=164332 RepID=A0A316H1P1_9RHOB|nr:efflux RND transporter periplasmic adaptor subunit [Roseicyclus mahoneyensis]PWK61331.1 multidrug efflux system membrane fusion protein [Roseicyclus mahoneyensis]
MAPQVEEHDTDAAAQAPTAAAGLGLPALRTATMPSPSAPARRVWLWAAAALVVAGIGAALYLQPWVARPVAVLVEIVTEGPATRVLAVNGQIAARHSVDVRALVGGRLAEMTMEEGDSVAQGDVLARIDAAGQQASVQQAVAVLDAALIAQARAEDALARAEALGANIARTELEAAGRALQTAMQDVARATAQVDQAQVLFDNHTLRAPMTGTILALYVDPGQAIDPATILMTIADLGDLIVEADVDEAYATRITDGLPALLQLAGEDAPRPGRVDFVSQRVDAATGGLSLRLGFDTRVRAPVGLTVTTNIIVDERAAAMTVPRAAIAETAEGATVFIVSDGIAAARAVTVIDWPAARLIVTDGLVPGEVLITDATGLADGQVVRVAVP